jgi:hypothetical protein
LLVVLCLHFGVAFDGLGFPALVALPCRLYRTFGFPCALMRAVCLYHWRCAVSLQR